MKNEQIFKNPELIPLLINYVKVNKVVFPIERVKYLSNEEVIEILKDCIDNQIIYNPNYEMVKNITLLEDKDLKEIIKPIGNYNKKALNILEISKSLLNDFNGGVPKTHFELQSMKGFERKTANVVLAELYDILSFAIEIHVIRVSNRLKLISSNKPEEIEEKLQKIFKKREWNKRHKQLVLFGRYKCKALKPECDDCWLK